MKKVAARWSETGFFQTSASHARRRYRFLHIVGSRLAILLEGLVPWFKRPVSRGI
jgi:hypothetical protein